MQPVGNKMFDVKAEHDGSGEGPPPPTHFGSDSSTGLRWFDHHMEVDTSVRNASDY